MDFEFSADQDLLRETVRRFLADRAPVSYVREMLDDPRGTTDEVWKGLAELGLTGILVPEEHGGSGMGMVDMGVVLEEMGRAAHPGPFLSSAVAGVLALRAVGHTALLPSLADGSVVATVAFDGLGYVPDAAAADVLVVDDAEGVCLVDDFDADPEDTIDGTRKMATVRYGNAERIGDPGALDGVRDRVLVALVTDGVGAAARALDMALEYAQERRQFGQPIGSFQAVQHLCSDMLQDVELGRAGAYYGMWAADAADPDELHRAAVMAKAFASDAFARIGADALHVHGGLGFTWEHDIHLYFKRLLTLQHVMGGAAHHLEELAKIVL